MKKTFLNIFYFCFIVLTLTGMCFLGTQYHPREPLAMQTLETPFTTNQVSAHAKYLSPQESQRFLKKDLAHWGYQSIWITIQNDTEQSYLLAEDGLDLPHVSSGDVALRVTSSAIPRSIALKIAGFLFWPFIIPSVIDTILTAKAYFDMRSSFYAKSIKEIDEELLPYSTVHRIIFVSQNQSVDEFTLYLKEGSCKRYLPLSISLDS